MKTTSSWSLREKFGFWLPAGLIFVYLFFFAYQGTGFLSRLLYSGLLAVAFQVGGQVAYVITLLLVHKATGAEASPEDVGKAASDERGRAAVLLAAAVWIWWQEDKSDDVDRIAECMEEHSYDLVAQVERDGEFEQGQLSDLVTYCHTEWGVDDYYEDDW